ncbi:MAG: hypothetical protein ACK5WS_00930 [Alphaproteobacteria bacterium]|jgi:hypothetical protein|nr:hypothetical protein [Candidatus Jidaibacter sp.]
MQNSTIRHDIGKRKSQEDTYLAYRANKIENADAAKEFLSSFHENTLACTNGYESGSCFINQKHLI